MLVNVHSKVSNYRRWLEYAVTHGQMQEVCLSQGAVATVYRWGGKIYNLLVWSFVKILHTNNGSFLTQLFKK